MLSVGGGVERGWSRIEDGPVGMPQVPKVRGKMWYNVYKEISLNWDQVNVWTILSTSYHRGRHCDTIA
jgi:hypothetical protein